MARAMVCLYGMSDLGIAVYRQGTADFAYSQKTAEMIDAEVNKILNSCYKKTMDLLAKNRDKLDKLAETLLENEHVKQFDITGRAMKGWVMVESEGYQNDKDLREFVKLSVKFVEKMPAK